MSILTLGIDTSNYTTSIAVCEDGVVTQNIKLPLPVPEGGVGLRQSDAVFAHTKNLPLAFEKMESDLKKLSAIGCSVRPRDASGSYMPCFLTGEGAARILSHALGVPLYTFSHQAGHIKAAVCSSKMPEYGRFYAYHLSGGTLELLTVTKETDRYLCDIKGRTLDVTAGQLIDRTGVMLGLSFPCGKELEALAEKNTEKYTGIKVSVRGCDCNLSGVQNKAEKLYADTGDRSLVSAFVLDFIKKTVDKMTENAMKDEKLPLLFSGGVSSNAMLRKYFSDKYGAYFAEPAFSSDNGAGAALLCYDKVVNGK